jgi:diguanylate cyclase (GGDEF)-like protein
MPILSNDPWPGVTDVPFSGDYDGSIAAVLENLRETADLEGVAILDLTEPDLPVPYRVGAAGVDAVTPARALLLANPGHPSHTIAADGRPVLSCPWLFPPSRRGGLVLWRGPDGTPWTDSDHSLAAAVGMMLNVAISSGIGQPGIDRMTGIPNRRWFLDEADRHIERLDIDDTVGTLSLIDIDDLRRLNLTLGRGCGDRVLVRMANQLRAMTRPGDVVARVGPDEFALWQTGLDHLTAAERADALCSRQLFRDMSGGHGVTFSIGIATRHRGSNEDVRTLLRRAHMAAREVKTRGGGGWRVSLTESAPRCSNPPE